MVCTSIATNVLSSGWPGLSHRGMNVASLKLQMVIKNKEKVAMECAGDLMKAALGETEGAGEKHFIFPVMTVLKSIFVKEQICEVLAAWHRNRTHCLPFNNSPVLSLAAVIGDGKIWAYPCSYSLWIVVLVISKETKKCLSVKNICMYSVWVTLI